MTSPPRIQHRRFESVAQEAVAGLLRAAARVHVRLDDVLRAHALTHDQYTALRILRGAHPRGLPRYAVAERLGGRAPDVTRLLDRLERQALVTRAWSEENRRLSIATITDAGLDLLTTVEPEVRAAQLALVEGLAADQLQAVADACDAIAG